MKLGEEVIWDDPDGPSRLCTIIGQNSNGTYDILLPERNVLFDSIYRQMNIKELITKGEVVIYQKQHNFYEAVVSKVDWPSQSLQIQIIMRNIL